MSIRFSSSLPRWWVGLVAMVALVGSMNRSALADSWSDARSALQSLEQYLKRHPTGPGWQEFLQLTALDAELKQGSQANRAAINTTLDLLNSGAAGSELPKFAALRKALYKTLLSNRADLASAFSASKSQFRPVTDAEVRAARSTLDQKLTALRSYFRSHPSTGSGWAGYLRLEEMTKELAAGDKTNPEALYSEYMPLYTNGHAGLEIPQIVSTGRAIRAYADLLTVKQNPQASIEHAQRMEQLAAAAKKLAAAPANADLGEFGELLGHVTADRQNPELVAAARRLYSQPNLIFLAKKKIVAAAMQNHIDDVAPLTDTILGTSIRGTTHTRGDVLLDLRNNPNRAEFDMHLMGKVNSKTVGFNGPAVINATGVTAIDGHKLIWLDDHGMHTLNNATATAKTSTTFTGFGATSKHFKGIVTKVASKRAYQNKSAAEYIASSRAAERVKNRVNQQSSVMVANSNRDIRTKIRDPLERWGVFPEDMHFSSDYRAVHGTVLAANSYQLGAPLPPPKIDFPGSHDVELRVHESTINNTAFTVFAGRTLTRDYVEKWFARNKTKVPDELQDEEQRDWSIVLDEVRPVHMTFGDGGFNIELRGTKWTSGDETYDLPMNISADYKFVITPAGVKAVRQGELKINPPNYVAGMGLENRQTILKRLLTRRFDKILKPEIVGEGIQLKGRLANYGKLFVRNFNSDTGWLQAALGK